LLRYQLCSDATAVARVPPELTRFTVGSYVYIFPCTSVRRPPIACRTASGAQVSHFLQPGLANKYACAWPSISSSTYTNTQCLSYCTLCTETRGGDYRGDAKVNVPPLIAHLVNFLGHIFHLDKLDYCISGVTGVYMHCFPHI